jgi:hypothetical protein
MYCKEDCCANCGYAEDFYPDDTKMICNYFIQVVGIHEICKQHERNPYYEENHKEELEDANETRVNSD